jgi:hypothetical protein
MMQETENLPIKPTGESVMLTNLRRIVLFPLSLLFAFLEVFWTDGV